jgi:hypothetical protein
MTNFFTATHESGIAAAQAIATEAGIDPNELRWFASRHLSESMPGLEEIGSSDVSIHLSYLGNYEPATLREEAALITERKAMLKRMTERTGRTEAEVLDSLRRLLAPN